MGFPISQPLAADDAPVGTERGGPLTLHPGRRVTVCRSVERAFTWIEQQQVPRGLRYRRG